MDAMTLPLGSWRGSGHPSSARPRGLAEEVGSGRRHQEGAQRMAWVRAQVGKENRLDGLLGHLQLQGFWRPWVGWPWPGNPKSSSSPQSGAP